MYKLCECTISFMFIEDSVQTMTELFNLTSLVLHTTIIIENMLSKYSTLNYSLQNKHFLCIPQNMINQGSRPKIIYMHMCVVCVCVCFHGPWRVVQGFNNYFTQGIGQWTKELWWWNFESQLIFRAQPLHQGGIRDRVKDSIKLRLSGIRLGLQIERCFYRSSS